ncbi:MAG: hypothetical protein IT449_00495 [Phycisphaerales bacterium]|nr:hypothetical protein [Phycisphaerales bacterium]
MFVEQACAARGNRYFRIEAAVRCDLSAPAEAGGGVLCVQALDARGRVLDECVTAPIRRSSAGVSVRAYYETPKETSRLRVRVGIDRAEGWLDLIEASLLSILEPEWRSHPVAIPAPQESLPPPRIARRIALVTEDARRALAGALRSALGGAADPPTVDVVPSSCARAEIGQFDALLLADERPPRAAASLGALIRLAEERTVVISLPAFAALAPKSLRVRTVEQPDDPLHAYVATSSPATRGFALHDAFSFGWPGRTPGSFAQHQFTRTAPLKQFCEKHGLLPLLKSLGNTDAASDRLVALHRPSPRGGLFVLDLLPLESSPSTLGETAPLMTLLLNILALRESGLGQYAVPVRTEADFRALIREMPVRFGCCTLHENDVPSEQLRSQILSIERSPDEGGGDRPAPDRPTVVVRSGLTGGDMESVYAAWAYFRMLVRMTPHVCPYAAALACAMRLVWQPLCAPWERADGFRRSGGPARPEAAAELERFLSARKSRLLAVIDLAARPAGQVRLMAPEWNRQERRILAWLPRLWESLGPGEACVWSTAPGADPADRDGFAWRRFKPAIEQVEDATVFDDATHGLARQAGAALWRLEIPGGGADFVAQSIERTNLGATLLEQVVGLHYGLIAVNRRAHTVEFPPFAPVAPGEALIIPARDAVLEGVAEPA